ncbi:hypothetical protein [Sorangium sp. So ce176]|uniref:hypothetical protein n=1 Tax=Sorangium sp. So ce176 TaxID=3133286 RepID=UPI003F5E3166
MKCAWLRGAARVFGVDLEEYRPEKAREVASAETVNVGAGVALEFIRTATYGRGAGIRIDAGDGGTPDAAREYLQPRSRPVGFGQAPVHKHVDKLLGWITEGKLRADDIVTHRLPLAETARGYDIFNAKKEGCVKVVLKP